MSPMRPAALDALEAAARESATAESGFRDSYAREIARLETERRRAYRRYNFLAALVAADAGTADRASSRAAQRAAAIKELDWSDASVDTDDALDAMTPLADAIFDEREPELAGDEAAAPDDPDAPIPVSATDPDPVEARAAAILFALAGFEERFEALRGKPFVELFDRTFPETPLVDF